MDASKMSQVEVSAHDDGNQTLKKVSTQHFSQDFCNQNTESQRRK